VAAQLGISPLHFGIMLIMNLSIGLCTPPVGSVLFVGCAVAKTSIAQTVRAMWPLYLAMLAVLVLTIFVPAVSEWLPRTFGLID
jgi:TRAP-type C4-dicarboxylate transport system permease large subunit